VPRFSHDIDLFRGHEADMQEVMAADVATLAAAGFQIKLMRGFLSIVTATAVGWSATASGRFKAK
jgi:hypothetical protein